MPVMDGLESTRQIRALEQRLGLEPALVIALTGLASEASQREAFASGINLFLTKPVPLKELGKLIETHKL
jgi:CheY-like chemotaxis protein